MPSRPAPIIYLVLGTMAAVVLSYNAALFILAVWSVDPAMQAKAMESFKDFGVYAAGVVSGCLIRTSTNDGPVKTTIENAPSDPIPTQEARHGASTATLLALCLLPLALTSCGSPVTASGSYTDERGRTYGGGVTFVLPTKYAK